MARIPGFFWFDAEKIVGPITAREADSYYHDTDAGIDDAFVVRASCVCAAEKGAREWLANRADETEQSVPDHLSLNEREYRPGKTYMELWVAAECC